MGERGSAGDAHQGSAPDLRKKTDRLSEADVQIALRILRENQEAEERER